MAATVWYRQCRMTKPERQDEVAWIPDKFSEVGAILKLRQDDGWTVVSRGEKVVSGEDLLIIRDACRSTRQVSDV